MLWKWTHEGFHGRTRLATRVATGSKPGEWAAVSDRTARRLQRAVCGIADCRCGEESTVAAPDNTGRHGWRVLLPVYGGTMRGRYPQT